MWRHGLPFVAPPGAAMATGKSTDTAIRQAKPGLRPAAGQQAPPCRHRRAEGHRRAAARPGRLHRRPGDRLHAQAGAAHLVRPGELRRAEWSEIDPDAAEWRIPAARMKMREAHTVPLSRQAVAIPREQHWLTGRER